MTVPDRSPPSPAPEDDARKAEDNRDPHSPEDAADLVLEELEADRTRTKVEEEPRRSNAKKVPSHEPVGIDPAAGTSLTLAVTSLEKNAAPAAASAPRGEPDDPFPDGTRFRIHGPLSGSRCLRLGRSAAATVGGRSPGSAGKVVASLTASELRRRPVGDLTHGL